MVYLVCFCVALWCTGNWDDDRRDHGEDDVGVLWEEFNQSIIKLFSVLVRYLHLTKMDNNRITDN